MDIARHMCAQVILTIKHDRIHGTHRISSCDVKYLNIVFHIGIDRINLREQFIGLLHHM